MGGVSHHRGGAFDEHFWTAHHHAGLAGSSCDGGLLAFKQPFVFVDSCASGGGLGGLGGGDGLRLVQRLGLASTTHHLHVGHMDAAATPRPPLALDGAMDAGLRRGGGLGSLGPDAGWVLVEFCGCGRFVCRWTQPNRANARPFTSP